MEAEGSTSRARKARAPPSHRVLVRKSRRTSRVCNHEDGPSAGRLKGYSPPPSGTPCGVGHPVPESSGDW